MAEKKLNPKQQALLDEVIAAGGQLWIEDSMTFSFKKKTASEGRSRTNAATSLLSEAEKRYCPGGFRRDVRLRLIEEQKVERRPLTDANVWLIIINRMLVEVL